jgi:hypothetical protein
VNNHTLSLRVGIMNNMTPEFFENENESELERDPTSPVFLDDLTDIEDEN